MIVGEIIALEGDIELNAGREVITLKVGNSGDRPIQVGSHYHFYETNRSLIFDRDRAKGTHLDIPAGTSIRFEPGDEKDVNLVPYVGTREIYGFNALVEGKLEN